MAIGLRLSEHETDKLMSARLREMREIDSGMAAAVSWAIDAGKRAAANKFMRKHALSDDEAFVLAAYRVATESWPLGLMQNRQTGVALVAHFEAQLERSAKPLQEEIEADLADTNIDHAAMDAKLETYKKKMATSEAARKAWRAATNRARGRV